MLMSCFGAQDMVEPAVADVIGPAVTADDPDALGHQIVCQRLQSSRLRRIHGLQLPFELCNTRTLFLQSPYRSPEWA